MNLNGQKMFHERLPDLRETARTIISEKRISDPSKRPDERKANIARVIFYAKSMMIYKNYAYVAPEPGLYPVEPQTWLEEVLAIGLVLAEELAGPNAMVYLSDATDPLRSRFVTKIVALLFFAAAELEQFDVISPVIDKIVQNLMCIDLLIPFFIRMNNHLAVSLLLDAYSDRISMTIKLCACLFMVKFPDFAHKAVRYFDELQEVYPIHVIAMRMNLIIEGQPYSVAIKRADELKQLVEEGLKIDSENPQMLYNAAYLEAMLGHKDKAYDLLSKSFKLKPYDHRTFLFLLRILRSYEQSTKLLQLHKTEKFCYARRHKRAMIEVLWALAATNQRTETAKVAGKMKTLWLHEPEVMSALTRVHLSLAESSLEPVKQCLREWVEVDNRSSEFFFCLAQAFVRLKSYQEAQRYLLNAIELDPCNAEYHASLALVYAANGEKIKANKQAKYGIQFNPFLPDVWLALSHVSEGQEAEDAKRKYIQVKESSVDMSNLKICLFVQGDSN